jgi:hypothetical protein
MVSSENEKKSKAKKFQNILRNSSENLLNKHYDPNMGNLRDIKKVKNSEQVSESQSKEIYTFGEKEREEETHKNYDLPSPKIKYKKMRVKTGQIKHLQQLDTNQKENTEKELSESQKPKNIFSDSFRSNPMTKGKNSPTNNPENLNVTPIEIPINFGNTFSDQPFSNEISSGFTKTKTKKKKLNEKFFSQREVMNMNPKSNRLINLKKPKINMGNISSTDKKKKGDSKNKSNSNSSESIRNMEPAWDDQMNFTRGKGKKNKFNTPGGLYQFKNTISPTKDFFRKKMKMEKIQVIKSKKKKKDNLILKGKFKTNSRRPLKNLKKSVKGTFKKTKMVKKVKDNMNVKKGTFGKQTKRLGSANKIFRSKNDFVNKFRKGTPKLGKNSSNILKNSHNTLMQKPDLILSQNNFMNNKFQIRTRERTNPKFNTNNITSRPMLTERASKQKSKEVHSHKFDSDFQNKRAPKTNRQTPGVGYHKKIKKIKKIPFDNSRQSQKKTLKISKQKMFTKFKENKKFSTSLYPNKGSKTKRMRQSNPSPINPSLHSIQSLNNVSPMNKKTGYYKNSVNFPNTNVKKSLSGVKKGGFRRKIPKKINVRREYFENTTQSFKTNSIGTLNSGTSLSIRKKFSKNRSRSGMQKPKITSLTKNYSKKKLNKPLLQRKLQGSKNLSMGHKAFSKYNSSQSREKRNPYGQSKYFIRGNSLTSPLKTSLKGSRTDWGNKLRSPSSSAQKKEIVCYRDKSKLSSRAAATSRYTSSDKNGGIIKTSQDSINKKGPLRLGKPKNGLRTSYMKAQEQKKKKRKINRNGMVSINEIYKMGYRQNF